MVALLLMVVVFAHLLYHERAELFSLLLFVGNHQDISLDHNELK
jgi:hypothetical protein